MVGVAHLLARLSGWFLGYLGLPAPSESVRCRGVGGDGGTQDESGRGLSPGLVGKGGPAKVSQLCLAARGTQRVPCGRGLLIPCPEAMLWRLAEGATEGLR